MRLRSALLIAVLAAGCGDDAAPAADAPVGNIDAPVGGPDAPAGSWVPYQGGDLPLGSVEGVIMLSNFTSVSRTGGAWALSATTSVAANVIHADQTVLASFSRSPDSDCLIYQGVTAWNSHMGLTPFTIMSSAQNVTATWNTTRYQLTGLVGGPGFASVADDLVVNSGATTVSVLGPQAPPFTDANLHLGAPAGLATEFSMPDTADFDIMFTFVFGTGPGAGEYGAMCEIAKADMALAAGTRSAPLVDAAAIARMNELGVVANGVNVAIYRVTATPDIFPGNNPINVQAGQMMTIAASALAP